MVKTKTIAWFSGGVSSAVAIKLAGVPIDQIIYTHIDDQHSDTLRFVKDCEVWLGMSVTITQSRYKRVNDALLAAGGKGYVNGPAGAPCTRLLKRRVRQEWELLQDPDTRIRYIWGFDATEKNRVERISFAMPDQDHLFPLIEQNVTKPEAHKILSASGISRPVMYDLGYQNNNCVGCVKGGMGYWNKIRRDFPDVFQSRAAIERVIGGTCIKGVYLDELVEGCGRKQEPICDECGIFCEIMAEEAVGDEKEEIRRARAE